MTATLSPASDSRDLAQRPLAVVATVVLSIVLPLLGIVAAGGGFLGTRRTPARGCMYVYAAAFVVAAALDAGYLVFVFLVQPGS